MDLGLFGGGQDVRRIGTARRKRRKGILPMNKSVRSSDVESSES